MWRTVIILLISIIIIPCAAFYFDSDALSAIQKSTLAKLAWIYVISAGFCFIISTLSKNYSQVDKLWSVIPIVYVWVACFESGFESRITLMAILVTVWGIRLTFNFSRRGGYKIKFWEGDEDYRWAILQAKPEFQSPIKWSLFNLFFISYYQMGLILLFTIPIIRSMEGPSLNAMDLILAVLFIIFVFIETRADNEQWNYQKEKHRRINNNEPLNSGFEKGFLDTGLWAKVRHPNYAAEQAVWIIFYCFSINATGQWINWSIMGCILLLLLFKSSSDFSEEISKSKYEQYVNYQKNVPRFIPLTTLFRTNSKRGNIE